MAENPDSKDKSNEAIDFIIKFLKEHEKNLDRLNGELAIVIEQLGVNTTELKGKVEGLEHKIDNLQKDVTNLIDYLSNSSKEK